MSFRAAALALAYSCWDISSALMPLVISSSKSSLIIVSILTMIKEDLEEEITNGIKAEEMSQQEYAKAKAAALKLIATLEEKKTNLEEAKAETDVKIGDAETLQEETEKLLKAKEEELM